MKYTGTIEYSEQDTLYYGKVEIDNHLISYEAKTLKELKAAFEEGVREYKSLRDLKFLESEWGF